MKIKKNVMLYLFLCSFFFLSATSTQAYFSNIARAIAAHAALSAKTCNFLKNIKNLHYKDIILSIRKLPFGERSSSIMYIAAEKKLISEADALPALVTLKKFEKRVAYLNSQGAFDNARKFDEYQSLLIKDISLGKSLSSEKILMDIKQLRNGGLAGTRHPVTNVLYNPEGFPIFHSFFDIKLNHLLYQAPDATQFSYATAALKEELLKNPRLRAQFSNENIERIIHGLKPKGYTWHHNEQEGVLQLVDTVIHQKTSHTGGRKVWGGGTEMRKLTPQLESLPNNSGSILL